jgi:hypothetical protein
MNKKGYSQILDVVARDQVPQHLDLAPNIMARIQNRRGLHMQPRTKLFSTTLLVVIVLVGLFYTVPGMAAALGRWFGYVPGVGLVREGQLRVLANPVSATREGVTVTVEQVVLDPERTALVYSVEGIAKTAFTTNPLEFCPYSASLRLPDGQLLPASPDGMQSWQTGYQHRFNFQPVPAAVNDVKLVIACLFAVRPGSAPEGWEIPLHFVPAPPDMTAFPVIEIPTPTAPAATATPAESPKIEASPQPVSMSLTLDRAVQMDDGYLIYATLDWKDTPFSIVEVSDVEERLHLLDASGQAMLYEMRDDEQTGLKYDQRQTVFAIKTAPVQTPGPLTLVLDAVSVEMPAKASFRFDPGPDPKPGQTWTLDQEVKIGAYSIRVLSATANEKSFTFEMSSNGDITRVMMQDLDHPFQGGGGGGGGSLSKQFSYGFNYDDGLPKKPVTISITMVGVEYNHRLQAEWTPPAASPNLLPTQPAACLTKAAWKAAKAQKPAIPDGVTGTVLTAGIIGEPGSGKWGAILSNLDGSNRTVIDGAQDGLLSPDGKKLAYSDHSEAISIMDLTTSQATPLPNTGSGDFNPVWSPDGQQIVFMRGKGIFDLFMMNLDGSNLRQLTHGGVQEWPLGWLADGRLLYTVPGRVYEYTNYALDVQSGASEMFSQDSLQSVSPDGKNILTIERTFGDRWLTYVSDLDGSNRWLLADSSLWFITPIWSPDGEWILAGVSDTDQDHLSGGMVNLRTCQVVPLPALKGNFYSWIR